MPDHVNDGRPVGACVVKRLERADRAGWDRYVDGAPRATFFHHAAWRDVIEGGLRHPCHYLYAERGGEVTGILPLAEMEKIEAALKRRFGRDVEIETAIDESLIGGAVIDAGDVVIDGSLKGKLGRLETALSH